MHVLFSTILQNWRESVIRPRRASDRAPLALKLLDEHDAMMGHIERQALKKLTTEKTNAFTS